MTPRAFFHLLSQSLSHKWPSERSILKQHAVGLLLLILIYYTQGVVTNLLSYYTVSRPPLWDFGFNNLSSPSQFLLYPVSVMARVVLYGLTLFAMGRFYITHRRAQWSIIFSKLLIIIVAISFIRICTILSTQLPPSSPHCYSRSTNHGGSNQDDSTDPTAFNLRTPFTLSSAQLLNAFMPWSQPLIFSLVPREICGGDGSFSLHTIGFVLCAMLVFKFDSSSTLQLATALTAALNILLLVVMKLNYSLDVWVSTFTTFLLFLFLDAKAGDFFGSALPLAPIETSNRSQGAVLAAHHRISQSKSHRQGTQTHTNAVRSLPRINERIKSGYQGVPTDAIVPGDDDNLDF